MVHRRFASRVKNNAFTVRLLNFQHNTWQGEIVCLATKEKQYFRSALELLNLIGSGVVVPEQAETVPEEE